LSISTVTIELARSAALERRHTTGVEVVPQVANLAIAASILGHRAIATNRCGAQLPDLCVHASLTRLALTVVARFGAQEPERLGVDAVAAVGAELSRLCARSFAATIQADQTGCTLKRRIGRVHSTRPALYLPANRNAARSAVVDQASRALAALGVSAAIALHEAHASHPVAKVIGRLVRDADVVRGAVLVAVTALFLVSGNRFSESFKF
jgi:hypothetical protein